MKIFKKLGDLFLQIILFFFSYIVPKKKNIILCGSGGGKSFKGNPKYFYLSNNKDKDLQIFWITENKQILDELKSKNLPVLYKYSLKGFYYILCANLLVVENTLKDISYIHLNFGNFNFIQTWHGTGFKNIGDKMVASKKGLGGNWIYRLRNFNSLTKKLLTSSRKYKLICATSKIDRQRKIESFFNPNVYITGSPRNDVFFNEKLMDVDWRSKLNLNRYKEIILYAPTFRDNKSFKPFSEDFYQKLSQILIKKKAVFLIKRHPLDNKSGGLEKKYANIIEVSKVVDDVQELLVKTDILITDYSGIVTDFVLTRKPVMFYTPDFDEYVSFCRDFYYDLKSTLPGPFVEKEDDLISNLDVKWFEDEIYQKKYKKFVNKFHQYQDGNSSERLFKLLKEKFL